MKLDDDLKKINEKEVINLQVTGNTVSTKSLQDSFPEHQRKIKFYVRKNNLLMNAFKEFNALPIREQTIQQLQVIRKKLKRNIQKLNYSTSKKGQEASARSSKKYRDKKYCY